MSRNRNLCGIIVQGDQGKSLLVQKRDVTETRYGKAIGFLLNLMQPRKELPEVIEFPLILQEDSYQIEVSFWDGMSRSSQFNYFLIEKISEINNRKPAKNKYLFGDYERGVEIVFNTGEIFTERDLLTYLKKNNYSEIHDVQEWLNQ